MSKGDIEWGEGTTIIDFDEDGLLAIHFFIEGLSNPVIVGTYSILEEMYVKCLERNWKERGDSKDIRQWCVRRGIRHMVIHLSCKDII